MDALECKFHEVHFARRRSHVRLLLYTKDVHCAMIRFETRTDALMALCTRGSRSRISGRRKRGRSYWRRSAAAYWSDAPEENR